MIPGQLVNYGLFNAFVLMTGIMLLEFLQTYDSIFIAIGTIAGIGIVGTGAQL